MSPPASYVDSPSPSLDIFECHGFGLRSEKGEKKCIVDVNSLSSLPRNQCKLNQVFEDAKQILSFKGAFVFE